jgi:hypothetical protein
MLFLQSIKEQTVSFVIFERNIDRIALNSASGTRIEQFFIQKGFSVLHGINETNEELFMGATGGDASSLHTYKDRLDSQLIAFTHIESAPSSKVSEGFFFAKSSITLTVVDVLTDEVVLYSLVEDVKGAGNTEVGAGKKAIAEATDKFIVKLMDDIDEID